MGVNVSVKFPSGVRMSDVATVAAILLGSEKEWDKNGRWINPVPGVQRESTSVPEMAYIKLPVKAYNNPVADEIRKSDGDLYFLSYHYESGKHGETSIIPKCTAAKIALCVGLVKFFGGTVDFNDCDSVNINMRKTPRKPIAPSDGKPWVNFQKAMDTIKPLTEKDAERVKKWAAY